jgi:glucose/mannose transport system substrate-binding protein
MLTRLLAAGVAVTALLAAVPAVAQPKTNMMHQFYRGESALAIAVLGEMFEARGGKWDQTPIAGHTANTIAKLRAEVLAGNAPPAVQLKGPEIAEWAATGLTANLDDVARKGGWEKVVAPELIAVMKPAGNWVAVPMNIHRIDWLFANPKVLAKVGVTELPKTWAEFNAIAEKLVAAGIKPHAHGSLDWIDATLFEIIVYGMDMDLYRNAFLKLEPAALDSPGMVKAFDQLRKMIEWTDPGFPGRQWDAALPIMLKGEAAFWLHGDWAIGYLTANNFKHGEDYVCQSAPVDSGKPGYIINSDSVIFFKQKNPDYIAGQPLLAEIIMTPEYQTRFNLKKGSIPARTDVDMAPFNPCQQRSLKDLQAAVAAGTTVRSMAHNMAVPQKFRGAMMEVITEFVNNPKLTSKEAAKQLAENVEAQL